MSGAELQRSNGPTPGLTVRPTPPLSRGQIIYAAHDMTSQRRRAAAGSEAVGLLYDSGTAQRLTATTFLIPLTSKARMPPRTQGAPRATRRQPAGRCMPRAHGLGPTRPKSSRYNPCCHNRAASVGRTCHSLQRCYPGVIPPSLC